MNNTVKKALTLVAGLSMITALGACGSSSNQDSSANSSSQNSSRTTSNASTDSKSIVIYFSASGNTKSVAENIASELNAPAVELTLEQPYTDDDLRWTNPQSRVVREYEDESLRDVKVANKDIDNWDSYDTVYLGFPTWWQIPAWPVNDFVKSNNFDGKTIIPFTISTSSGIGNDAEILRNLAGSGTWLTGHRFSQSASAQDVKTWLADTNNGLNEQN
ncbi:flavodoxin [Alloscardovia theropitheci]|uniref:Flavodoxin n=1 Tax=Alloscardovia theropitheci TaxID=2496842 RepID=A0A4R0QSG1_9BIFI|nr:flavodoxin [Alloscardovia theropitheci]TCD54368.1 flavodoxin [Alloscardovia theropitheci]